MWVGALVLTGALVLVGVEVALELDEDGVALPEAWADFSSSCLAFFCEVVTAPWALATAPVRPATPGAEPW